MPLFLRINSYGRHQIKAVVRTVGLYNAGRNGSVKRHFYKIVVDCVKSVEYVFTVKCYGYILSLEAYKNVFVYVTFSEFAVMLTEFSLTSSLTRFFITLATTEALSIAFSKITLLALKTVTKSVGIICL